MDNWIEIFRGGRQVDSAGRVHDGDAIIARAVANFNASEHEPPLVIGHPKDNAPAWGWVAALRVDTSSGGKRLLAQPRQVAPEFAELVRSGRFKKRSASFYADGRLRHVGFLGAMPPAVKGLSDVAFAEAEGLTFEFGDYADSLAARAFRRLREWLISSQGQEVADTVLPNDDIEYMQTEASRPEPAETPTAAPAFAEPAQPKEPTMADNTPTFTEADLATAVAKAQDEARAQVLAEFTEREQTRLAAERQTAVTAFCEHGVAAGHLAPAWVKSGLKEFLLALPAEPTNFGESGEKSPYAWFTELLQSLPKLVEFKELAGRGNDSARALSRTAFDGLSLDAKKQHLASGGTITD